MLFLLVGVGVHVSEVGEFDVSSVSVVMADVVELRTVVLVDKDSSSPSIGDVTCTNPSAMVDDFCSESRY